MEKIPLGLREGETENREVVKDLLASIQDRGFTLYWRLREELAVLRDWVAGLSAEAAASLDEVGEELLMLPTLDITGELRKS